MAADATASRRVVPAHLIAELAAEYDPAAPPASGPPDPTPDAARRYAAALAAEVKAAVAEAVGTPLPLLLGQPAAMAYVGLSRSSWFRAKSAGQLPRPVYVEGSGERWRRKDLDAWVERLKPHRRRKGGGA